MWHFRSKNQKRQGSGLKDQIDAMTGNVDKLFDSVKALEATRVNCGDGTIERPEKDRNPFFECQQVAEVKGIVGCCCCCCCWWWWWWWWWSKIGQTLRQVEQIALSLVKRDRVNTIVRQRYSREYILY